MQLCHKIQYIGAKNARFSFFSYLYISHKQQEQYHTSADFVPIYHELKYDYTKVQ